MAFFRQVRWRGVKGRFIFRVICDYRGQFSRSIIVCKVCVVFQRGIGFFFLVFFWILILKRNNVGYFFLFSGFFVCFQITDISQLFGFCAEQNLGGVQVSIYRGCWLIVFYFYFYDQNCFFLVRIFFREEWWKDISFRFFCVLELVYVRVYCRGSYFGIA